MREKRKERGGAGRSPRRGRREGKKEKWDTREVGDKRERR